ncbi:MAG: vanadium nitrogenase [Lachnospiraceae bacterium]|nr:vanadium nitrogenase [Lachnospiraceae bacterium]
MENLILFVNSFLSYLLVFVVSIVVAGVAMFAGYKMRVRKDLKTASQTEQEQSGDGQQ